MISQQRFEELVVMGRKGGLHVNEAIKLAVHESLQIQREEVLNLVTSKILEGYGIKEKVAKND